MSLRQLSRSFFSLLLDFLFGKPEPAPAARRSDFDRIADYPGGYKSASIDTRTVLR